SALRGAPCGRRFRRSQRRAHPERRGDVSGAAGLIRVSPAAGQPIHLSRRSECRNAPPTIDPPALIPPWDPIPLPPDRAVSALESTFSGGYAKNPRILPVP